ncbi:hypothetical protein BJV74DRAFT_163896 [Russula compacta]|nr:hypothetical protein BJV74DRAFT_163896 [Russula compacta]
MAIAARMARLGGTRVGMGPPIFGRKPENKPKPAVPASEMTKEEPATVNVPVTEPVSRSERDVEHAQAEAEVAADVPLPTSPPTNETATEALQLTSAEYFPQQPPASASPNIPSRAMPVPQGPRRAAPPRKKFSQKQTPPAETEATTLLPEKDTPIHDSSDIIPESQSAPVPVPGHVEPEVGAADPNTGVYASAPEYVDEVPTEDSSRVAAPPALAQKRGQDPSRPLVLYCLLWTLIPSLPMSLR